MKKMLLGMLLISFVSCCKEVNIPSLEDACKGLKWIAEERRPFYAIRDHVICDEQGKLPFESIESVLVQWHQEDSKLGSYMMKYEEEVEIPYTDMFIILAHGLPMMANMGSGSGNLPEHFPACYKRIHEVIRVLKQLGAKRRFSENALKKDAFNLI